MGKIREIDGTVMLENGWVDLEKWTGRPASHIPLFVREQDEAKTHISSLMAEIGDPACDPRSGGIAGIKSKAVYFRVSGLHFRRNILPDLEWMRYLGNIPVTNVTSADYGGQQHQAAVMKKHCDNLGITPKA